MGLALLTALRPRWRGPSGFRAGANEVVTVAQTQGEAASVPEAESSRVMPKGEDLIVKAVTVQGGEAEIAGEKTAFARIVMSGVGPRQVQVEDKAPRRQEIAVLRLDDAAALAASLNDVVDRIVRSTPTPAVPASGIWSWTSAPLLDEDLLVAQAKADGAAVLAGMAATVRVDFTGTLVHGLAAADPRCARAGGNLLRSPAGAGARQQLEKGRAVSARATTP